MTKFEMVKGATGLVVSIGVGAIVRNAIKSTTPDVVGTFTKVCMVIGGMVLVSMIQSAAIDYTDNIFDSISTQFKEGMDELKTA